MLDSQKGKHSEELEGTVIEVFFREEECVNFTLKARCIEIGRITGAERRY